MEKFGFKCVPITDEEIGIFYEFYMRSPVEVLRNQVKVASSNSTFFDPPTQSNMESHSYFHPMMAGLGVQCTPTMRSTISSSNEPNVFWHTASESVESSFIGMIQMYSE